MNMKKLNADVAPLQSALQDWFHKTPHDSNESHYDRSDVASVLKSLDNLAQQQIASMNTYHKTFLAEQDELINLFNTLTQKLDCQRKIKTTQRYWFFFKRTVEEEIVDTSIYNQLSNKDLDDWLVQVTQKVSQIKFRHSPEKQINDFKALVDTYQNNMNVLSMAIEEHRNHQSNVVQSFIQFLTEQYRKMSQVHMTMLQTIAMLDMMKVIYYSNLNRGQELEQFILAIKQAKSINMLDGLIQKYQQLQQHKENEYATK